MEPVTKTFIDVFALHEFAKTFLATLPGGSIVGLSGPLGAGKTEFVRGISIALGLPPESVTSPTYVLEQRYEVKDGAAGIKHISHWDLYRVADSVILDELLERASFDTLVFVEWPERIPELASYLSFLLSFAHGKENERVVTVRKIVQP